MVFCVDFDGTMVSHEFPDIGNDIGSVPVLKKLISQGHKINIFTMRSGAYLEEALKWCRDNGIELYGINTNPGQHEWTDSPKAYGNLYIDDASLGAPLKFDSNISRNPFIDWEKAEVMIEALLNGRMAIAATQIV